MISETPARIRITVWGLAIALVAMIAVASSFQIWNAYQRALADSQAQALDLATAYWRDRHQMHD